MPVERVFVGGAGTGKTYQLIGAVRLAVQDRFWLPHESILALTFMHGARRRLQDRLATLARARVPVEVETIDAFCLGIVNRYRRRLGRDLPVIPTEGADWTRSNEGWHADFSAIQLAAVELLAQPIVLGCVAASYPLLVVDEFQDCDQKLVEVIKCLVGPCRSYLAADPFQRLAKGDDCPIASWLDDNAEATPLRQIHRTHRVTLLNSATALREGMPHRDCIEVIGVSGPGLAAWEIAKLMHWSRWHQGTTALITPARCSFVDTVVASLSKSLGKAKPIPPYPFGATQPPASRFVADAMLTDQGGRLTAAFLLALSRQGGSRYVRLVAAAAHHRIRLRGHADIATDEVIRLAKVIANRSPSHAGKRTLLTVHEAKNQEFDRVVVLWPYKLSGDELYRRKLLYNAVTRARDAAVVLVEGGDGRVAKDPTLALLSPTRKASR